MLLSVKDLRVRYGKVEAVKGISFEVGDGDIVTLLGANGAGKTTTLLSISGLLKPASGQIVFSGERIDGKKPSEIVRLRLGHVPEGRHLFPYMSVEDNLLMGAFARSDGNGVREDLEVTFDRFPILKERRRQQAGSMSGGEQQILAIARALMGRPRLLLLDEPSIGLSPIMVEKVAEVIASINQGAVSILLVEQNAAMALKLANCGYVIEVGRIVVSGTRDELLTTDNVKKAYLGA